LAASENPETEGLLRKARAGDESACELLLTHHRERLRRMISVRMDDRLSARFDPSDVVQETLIVAAERLPEYLRGLCVSFYPWLRQIAWNRLVDLHRAHLLTEKRSVCREAPLGLSESSAASLANRLVSLEGNALTLVLREELRSRVRATLAKLAPADQEILVLRHLEQLSGAESAEVLGVTESAAKQRHVRAVRRLRRLLDVEMPEAAQ
jgi:RNA polymerase sigma-70 factor, ECF subfamily